MKDSKEVVVREARELVSRSSVDNPIGAMLQAIVDKGVTTENAAALEKVCALYEKMDAIGARKAFAAARCLLQAELPSVMATKMIPSKTGEVRSMFAPYEEIMGKVGPYLVKHGFSVSFTMKADGGRMEAFCTLTHSGGHSESNSFSVRVGSGPPGCSEAQSDGSARSYARRGALCDALNIIIDKDTDAHLEGACIDADTARELAARAKEAGLDEKAFLRLAGAQSFATIREHKLPILEQVLRERKTTPASAGPEVPGGGAATDESAADSPALDAQRSQITDLCAVLMEKAKEEGKAVTTAKLIETASKQVLKRILGLSQMDAEQLTKMCDRLKKWCEEKGIKT